MDLGLQHTHREGMFAPFESGNVHITGMWEFFPDPHWAEGLCFDPCGPSSLIISVTHVTDRRRVDSEILGRKS